MTDKRTFRHGDKDARRQKAYERLGTTEPSCIVCGVTFPHALERHHLAQRQFHDHTVIVCQNHHSRLSDMQKDHPGKIAGCTNALEPLGHLLLGLGDMAEVAADELRDPLLANFLVYLRGWLAKLGLASITAAGTYPNQDIGLVL